MNSDADFVACDNPAVNRLTLHILATEAESATRTISERTKAALNAAKARGVKLGSARPGHWKGREQARLEGLTKARAVAAMVRRERAEEAYADLRPVMVKMRTDGMTLAEIAKQMNAEGLTTRRGKPWNPVQVSRVLERAESTQKQPNTKGA